MAIWSWPKNKWDIHKLDSRVQSQSYPSGFVAYSQFNNQGYMAALRDGDASGNILSQTLATNAFGSVTESQVGFGAGQLTSTRGYNPLNGLIESIYTDGGQIQDLTYEWWSNGNLHLRDSGTANATETFGYDALDRLQDATTNHGGTRVIDYNYDKFGNLTLKDDPSGGLRVTNYTYQSGKGKAGRGTLIR